MSREIPFDRRKMSQTRYDRVKHTTGESFLHPTSWGEWWNCHHCGMINARVWMSCRYCPTLKPGVAP